MAQPNISGFHIDRLLGRGGFATVYLATDAQTRQPAAIKVLREHATSEDDLKRFERERLSMTALSGHPHIVGVLRSGQTEDGHHFMVIEYVEGGSIRDVLAQSGAMHWADVLPIGVQICSALDAAHRSGVLHRDIKPANILLDSKGAKLGDFGIARLVGQSNLTAAQSIIGTLAYTPPEIFHNGAFDGRGDIYQLGITLYEMLLGRAPFTSAAADNKGIVIRRILENPAPPLAQFDIPVPLSDLLDEVLAKNPNDRPQTASEFGRRLNEVEIMLGRPATPLLLESPSLATTQSPVAESTVTNLATDVPAAPTASQIFVDAAPQPPIITPPSDSPPTLASAGRGDHTVVERSRTDTTSVIPAAVDHGRMPVTRRPRRRRRIPMLVGAFVGIVAIGVGGFFVWQSLDEDGGTDTTLPDDTTTTTSTPDDTIPDATDPPPAPVVQIDQPAFTDVPGSDGLLFSAVANSQGLTAVGATGEGENVRQQQSAVWTMSATGSWDLRADFAESEGLENDSQRLWDIGVIDGVQFLAVGDGGSGSTDGIGWIGLRAGEMRPTTDASFTGAGDQTLRGVVGDSANASFIVVGQRRGESAGTLGLWIVSEGDSWATPDWTVVPIGDGVPGLLSDVVVADEDVAVAVGWEIIDGREQAVMVVRRDGTWLPLLEPIVDARLEGVTVAGDRVIASGYRQVDGVTHPIAIVTDFEGNGFVHKLPVDGVSGRSHAVAATALGTVIAVGEIGEEPGDDAFGNLTDGAVWELITGDDLAQDRWTTRERDALRVDGLQEFWAVIEFSGTTYALGKSDSEDDDRRLPSAWQIDLRTPA